jgi:hypothetical protein
MTNERVASSEETMLGLSRDLRRAKDLLAKVGLHDNEVREFLGHPPVEPECSGCRAGYPLENGAHRRFDHKGDPAGSEVCTALNRT